MNGPQRNQRPADATQAPQPPVEPAAEPIVEPAPEPVVEPAAATPAPEPAPAPSPEPTSDAPSLDSAPYAETHEPDGWDQPEGRPPLGELAEQSAPKEN